MKKYILKSLVLLVILTLFMSGITLAQTGTITGSTFLNLRESPSTSSNLVVRMPGNATFEIIGEDGDWYQIQYQDYTGYVSKQYVKVETQTANTNIAPTANAKGIINQNSDVYVLPLLNSSKLNTISSGSEVLVISITGKWAYVQNDTVSGWIFASNVNGVEGQSNSETNQETDNQEINDEGNNSGEQTNNNENTDNQNAVDENTLESTETTDNEEQTQTGDSSYPKTMYVNVEAVYIRASTSTDSEAVASVGLNTPVTVNGEDGDWYKVYVTDGTGYMMKQYLSEERQ